MNLMVFHLNFVIFVFQYENPWTIPNMLSMTRIGLAPVLGYLIIEEDFNVALGVFALAGLTDLVSYKCILV
jgi:phosphatidylglycerophosphate synthase